MPPALVCRSGFATWLPLGSRSSTCTSASPIGRPLLPSASVISTCCEPLGNLPGCMSRWPSACTARSALMRPKLMTMPSIVFCCWPKAGSAQAAVRAAKAAKAESFTRFMASSWFGGALMRVSTIDECRDVAAREHLVRLAAVPERRHAAPAVRAHEDRVAAVLLRGADDRLVGTVAQRELSLKLDVLGLGARRSLVEDGACFHGRLFLVFVYGLDCMMRHDLAFARDRVLGQRREEQHLGASLARVFGARGYGLRRRHGPIGRNQDVAIHGALPFRRSGCGSAKARACAR